MRSMRMAAVMFRPVRRSSGMRSAYSYLIFFGEV